MKKQLIEVEVDCIDDCLELAQHSFERGNLKYTKILLEDALKSVNEIERLGRNETVVLVGTILTGGNRNDRI